MANGNWVCFDCHSCVRRPAWRLVTYYRPWLIGAKGDETVKCPSCNQPCRFLGPSIRIPAKGNDAAWDQLRAEVMELRDTLSVQRQKQNTRRKHQLERLVLDLERRPKNKERDLLIDQLRNELVELGT